MVAQINPPNSRTCERVPAKPRTRSQLWPKGSGRAPARVIEVRRRYPSEQTRVTSESRAHRSRRPELLGLDAVAFHLEVQGLVVDPQEARRFTLVPPCGLKSHADRLPLRLGGGPGRDILHGRTQLAVTSH